MKQEFMLRKVMDEYHKETRKINVITLVEQ